MKYFLLWCLIIVNMENIAAVNPFWIYSCNNYVTENKKKKKKTAL